VSGVALCVITHDRQDEVRAALESVDDSRFDDIVVVDMASDPPVGELDGARVFTWPTNAGVAVGRNAAAREADAALLVFLDDDAVFLTGAVADRVRNTFEQHPDVGALAFRVVRPGGATASSEHPFRGAPTRTSDPRECAYFVGAAFAVRRDAFLDAGGFDERYFYSTEEVDLAFGLAKRGWRLRYEPDIVAEHRPSRRGREVEPHVPMMRARNRIVLVRRHLPAALGLIHVAAWLVRTMNEARRAGSLGEWYAGVREGFRMPVNRDPMRWRTAMQLHRLGGRVLW
jgi:GT2 family glycosyltransferase